MNDTPTNAETVGTALADTLSAGASGASMVPGAPLGARYTLGELLGRGGMGEIWLARDVRIGRDVAVKLVRGGAAAHGEHLARFLREARVQGRLEHPAIVPIHDLGIDEQGQPYFAMKRVTGATLADILAQRDEPEAVKRWPTRTLLARLVDVCQAIEFAHRRDVVHRDLKPANIMLGDLGEVYVLDWGIAHIVGDAATSSSGRIAEDGIDTLDEAHTVAGAMLGTPGYMSPEQIRGESVDHRTDVYALGCILFEILAGRSALPVGSDAIAATLDANAFRPRDLVAEVPPELDDVCAAATAPDPAARTATAAALADGIQRYLDGDRDLAHRRELAQAAADDALRVFEAEAPGARSQAMQGAGRALALDPTHVGAQKIIGRLLLEPPQEIPAEVETAVHAARVKAARVQLRIGTFTYLTYFVFLPFVFAIDLHEALPLVGVGVALLANAALTWYAWRRATAVGNLFVVILLIQGLLMFLVSLLISPIIVTPALATTSLTIFIAHPTTYRPVWVVSVHIAALLGPLVLELANVLPHTMRLVGDGVFIRPWFGTMSGGVLLGICTLALLIQLVAGWFLVSALRRAEESAQQRVHLQSWHLKQLLPSLTED